MVKVAYCVYYSPRDIDIFCTSAFIVFLHRFLISHLVDLVSEVDLKEILGDSLIHSFRFAPTFRSFPQLPRLVVSAILVASSLFDFSRAFRSNTVSSPLSLIEHYYSNIRSFTLLLWATTLNVTLTLYFSEHLRLFIPNK